MMEFGELEITIKVKENANTSDAILQAINIAQSWQASIDLEISEDQSIVIRPNSDYNDIYEKWMLSEMNHQLLNNKK